MNSLKLSADTLERIPMCGYEYDHVHSQDCYDSLGNLTCGLHQHTDACYQERPDHEWTVTSDLVDEVVPQVELDLGGEEMEATAPEQADAQAEPEVPAAYSYDMKSAGQALLSQILEAVDIPVEPSAVLFVDAVNEDQADRVSITRLDGDFEIVVLRDFASMELVLDTGSDIPVIELLNGAAESVDQDEEAAVEAGQPVESDADVETVSDAETEQLAETELDAEENTGDEDANTDTNIIEETQDNEENDQVDQAVEAAPADSAEPSAADVEDYSAKTDEQPAEDEQQPVEDEQQPAEDEQPAADTADEQSGETVAEQPVEPEQNDATTVENEDQTEIDLGENVTEPVESEADTVEPENETSVDEGENVTETEPEAEAQPEAEPEVEIETEPAAGDAPASEPDGQPEAEAAEPEIPAVEETEASAAGIELPAVAPEAPVVEAPAAEPEAPAAPVYTPGERAIEVNDAVVTLSWGPEAEIPEDVRVEVVEIERGTEAYDILYNNAMDALSRARDTETTTQVMRFFDITLYVDDEKYEPKSTVSVTVKVNEAEATDDDADVDALHMEEVGAQAKLVEATTESDTVSFEAESFSIYGVSVDVPATEVTEKVDVAVDLSSVDLMDAAQVGQTVTLSIPELLTGADEDVEVGGDLTIETAAFLETARFSADDAGIAIDGDKLVLSQDELTSATVALEATAYDTQNYETVATTRVVEIELTGYQGRTDEAQGENITVTTLGDNSLPADAKPIVTEGVAVPDALISDAENEAAAAFEITVKNGNGEGKEISETGAVSVTVTPENLNVLNDLPQGTDLSQVQYVLYHIHDGVTTVIEDVAVDVSEDGAVTSFSFETDGFSTIVLKYTVDFEYNGHKWSFPGLGSYAIVDIMKEIGVEGEIDDVSLECVEGEQIPEALYLEEKADGWYLTSDCAFDETYELTVIADGGAYVIIVTDDQVIENIEINYYEEDGTTSSTPDLSDGKYYFLLKGEWGSTNKELYKITASTNQYTGHWEEGAFGFDIVRWTGEKPIELGDLDKWDAPITRLSNGKLGDYEYEGIITDATYKITATKMPTYTAALSFQDVSGNSIKPSLDGNYYMLAKCGSVYKAFAPVTTEGLGAITGSMVGVDAVEFVKLDRDEATLDNLKNCNPKISNGGVIAGKYLLTIPAADADHRYAITAVEQPNRKAEIYYADTVGAQKTVAPNGNYYIIASVGNNETYYAPITGSENGALTFYDNQNTLATVSELPYISAFTLKRTDSAAANLDGAKNGNDVSMVMTDNDGKKYILDYTVDNEKYVFNVRQTRPYEVEIKFLDQNYKSVTPKDTTGNYKLYGALTRNGKVYGYISDSAFTLNEATKTVSMEVFKANAQNNQPAVYCVATDAVSVQLVNEHASLSDTDGNLRQGSAALAKGDTIGSYELVSVNADTASGKATIIFREVAPYTYSFKALAEDGTTPADVDLTDSGLCDEYWYLVTKLVKAQGGANYYKVVSLGNLNGKGENAVTGDFQYFYENGVESSPNKAVYVTADVAETRLVHMRSSVDQNNYGQIVNVFNDMQSNAGKNEKTDNKYFTGGDGLYKYTVRTVDSSGQGAVTLTKAVDPVVTVNAYDTDGTTSVENLLKDEGADNYYLYVRLTEENEYGYLEKLDTASATKAYTIPYFKKYNENRQKYLTGTLGYDAWIIRKNDNGEPTSEQAYNQISNGWDQGITVYQNGGTIGCAVIDRSRATGDAVERNTTINLTKVPNLTLNSKIFNPKMATVPAADSGLAKNYYVLLSMQEGNETVYHLQKLDVSTAANEDYTIQYFTKDDGTGKYYYIPGKTLTMQLVTSDNELTLNDAVNSGRFNDGSVTGELYQVKLAQDGYALSCELRKLDESVKTSHTVETYFYSADKATVATITPALGTTNGQDQGHKYYFVATLKSKGSDAVAAYRIDALDMTDTNGQITTTLEGEYKIIDAGGNNIGVNMGYDPDLFDVSVRLYHKDTMPGDYLNAAVYGSPSDVVPGYDFMSNQKVEGQEVTEIKLHTSYLKDYKVRVNFDPSSPAITDSDKLYLLVTLAHQTTGTEYGLAPLGAIAEGSASVDYASLKWHKQQDGNLQDITSSITITGNETATVRLLRVTSDGFDIAKAIAGTDCVVFGEGDIAKACTVSYAQAQTREDEDNATTHITDYVNLTRIPASSDYSFTDILGEGVYYGINANVFNQQNHIQSNFAVNTYYGNGQPIEADLASEAGAFIAADIIDSMFIGASHSGDVLLYVNPEDAHDGVAPRDPRDFVYTVSTPKDELRARVNAILTHGASMSAQLAAHEPTFTPKDIGKNYIEIDTYDFPDDATIYLDGDALRGYIATTSGIKLTKKPNQMIVFNFKDAAPLKLGKFEYRYGRNDSYMVTDSPIGHGDAQNDNIDLIAKHVVWNVQNATEVDANIVTGMYLIPNPASKTVVSGTSSGWIISGGEVTNTGGEWHSVYGELPSVSKTNLNVGKTIDGKTPNGSQVFNFTVEHLNNGVWNPVTFTNGGVTTDTVQNTNGTLKADNITVLNEGWNIYRIKESATIPATTQSTGEYTVDGRAIYAVVQYVKKTAAGGSTAWIATTPVYYIEDENGTVSFAEAAWTPNAKSIADAFGSATSGAVNLSQNARPAFRNTTKKDRLSVSKVVTGTADNTKLFSFTLKVMVPDPNNDGYTPWNGTDAEVKDNEKFTIQITGMDEPIQIALPEEADYDSATYKLTSEGTVTFTLTAGQTAGFNGLPIRHKYIVTENNPKANPGYALKEGQLAVREGTVEDQETVSSVTFTNAYTASGDIQLSAGKTLYGRDPKENETFTFQLRQEGVAEPLQTKQNVGGTITFDPIQYTQDDMAGATLNTETGLYEKVMTYTIVEVVPENPDPTISYDTAPKTVTVKLVDNGAGIITATPTYPDGGAAFANTAKTDVTVQKVWRNANGTGTWPTGVTVTASLYVKTGESQTQEGIQDARGNALTGDALNKTLSAQNPTATWENLDKLDESSEYIVVETAVSGGSVQDGIVTVNDRRFRSETEGTTITNTELTQIAVQKSWKDNKAPENAQVVVQLYSSTQAPDAGHAATPQEDEPVVNQENTVTVKVNLVFDSSMSDASDFKIWTQQFPYSDEGRIKWEADANQNWNERTSSGNYTYTFTGVTSDGTQKDYIMQYGIVRASEWVDLSSDYNLTITQGTGKMQEGYPVIRGNASTTQEITIAVSYKGAQTPTETTRDVPVTINWTGTPASGSTVTVTAAATDGSENKTGTVSWDGSAWTGTISGMVVGKTYNVSFTPTDSNATVTDVREFTVGESNNVATNGIVTEEEPLSGGKEAKITIKYDKQSMEGIGDDKGFWYNVYNYPENSAGDYPDWGVLNKEDNKIGTENWYTQSSEYNQKNYEKNNVQYEGICIQCGYKLPDGYEIVISGSEGIQRNIDEQEYYFLNTTVAEITIGVKKKTSIAGALKDMLFPMAYAESLRILPTMAGEDAPDLAEISAQAVAGTAITLNGSETAAWYHQWTDLPTRDAEGNSIYYYVVETAVRGISANSVTATYTHTTATDEGYTHITQVNIENETSQTETTSATVKKVWNDAENQDGIRPSTLTVKLLKDSVETGRTVTLSSSNNWQDTISGLEVDHVYTWQEQGLPDGYTLTNTETSGTVTTLTNTHTPETIGIQVSKTWSINDSSVWPANVSQVVIGLFANGAPVMDGESQKTVMLTSTTASQSFANLPKKSGGSEITYTVKELSVTLDAEELKPASGEDNIGGFTVTNGGLTAYDQAGMAQAVVTNSTGTVDAPISKIWKLTSDGNAESWYNGEGENAKPIQVTLYKRYQIGDVTPKDVSLHTFTLKPFTGEKTIDNYQVVGEKKEGIYTFTVKGLPAMGLEDNQLASYSYLFKEEALSGFTTSYQDVKGNTYTGSELEHGVEAGGKIINTLISVSLPATGGRGTTPIYVAGASLLILAVLGLVWLNRKRVDGDGI